MHYCIFFFDHVTCHRERWFKALQDSLKDLDLYVSDDEDDEGGWNKMKNGESKFFFSTIFFFFCKLNANFSKKKKKNKSERSKGSEVLIGPPPSTPIPSTSSPMPVSNPTPTSTPISAPSSYDNKHITWNIEEQSMLLSGVLKKKYAPLDLNITESEIEGFVDEKVKKNKNQV